MEEKTDICSVANPNKGTGFCSRDRIRTAIKKYGDGSLEGALKNAKVNDEVSLLSSLEFRKFAKNNGITDEEIRKHIDDNFAPEGPSECCDLFSNFNIEDALADLQKKYPWLYVHECNMINFEEYGGSLAKTPASKYDGYKAMACVLNTDVSNGKGRHWVCIFGDFRDSQKWTLEFFNSSGNGPGMVSGPVNTSGQKGDIYAIIMDYLDRLAIDLEKRNNVRTMSVIVTDIRNPHQKSNTECGPYCVYYIHKRCEGVPYKKFRCERIPDKVVTRFRKVVFRPSVN